MTPQERIARAERAQRAYDEFLQPIFDEISETYAARLVEIASTELDSRKRADKVTALSFGLRIKGELEQGIKAVIEDGPIAEQDKLRANKLERMTPEQRRIFGLVPAR